MKQSICRKSVAAPHARCVRACARNSRREVLWAAGLGTGLGMTRTSSAASGSVYDFEVQQFGKPVGMDRYKGQALVIVKKLYETYRGDGFNLVAFPCNQFGGQAPGTSQEERDAALNKFGINLDVMDHLDVNGESTHPLYKYLRSEQPVSVPKSSRTLPNSTAIEWNYTKFLCDRSGQPVKRYGPSFDPLEFESDVRLVLAGKDPLPAECLMHPSRLTCSVERRMSA